MRQQSKTCEARRQGDQMQCRCGLAWDINDPEPPQCQKAAVGNEALGEARKIIAGNEGVHLELISLKEMPLRYLPSFGIGPGLFLVDWPSQPHFGLVLISRPEFQQFTQGRDYLFFSKAGSPLVELQIREDSTGRTASRRDVSGPIPGEWVAA